MRSRTDRFTGSETRAAGGVDRRTVLALAGIFLGVLVLWDTFLVYPLKVLVVLLHEISHGLAAVLTGGSIDRIEVNSDGSGVCYTLGGSRFVTLSAGYLGSMGLGALILVGASRSRSDRPLAAGVGVVLVAITLLFVRNAFGFAFGLAFGAALAAAAWKLPARVADTALKIIGLTSCLYAILDIKSDILDRPGIGSDADMLAEYTRIPTLVWGALWILAALAAAGLALRAAARGERLDSPPAGGDNSTRERTDPHP